MNQSATTPPARRRVLIVEDHPLYREGMKNFLNHQPDFICCGEADTCTRGLQAACALKPDLVILDLRLHQEDGMELLRSLNALDPPPRVLVLTQKEEVLFAGAVLRAGALGYLMKDEATETLALAARAVVRGELFVSSRLAALVLKHSLQGDWGERGITQWLSDRELQVFELLGRGLASRQVAEQLSISPRTVEAHEEHIKAKLGIASNTDLAATAREWHREAGESKPKA